MSAERTAGIFTINAFPLIPHYAVLNPRNTVSLPPFFTATTGMDALTHAVEAYIGQSTTNQTRAWSVQAVRLVSEYLLRAYRDGGDLEARRAMLRASYLAGMSFTRSYVGYCHAVAHSLGGRYDTPHGLANSVLLPYVLRAYGKSVYRRLKELAVVVGLADERLLDRRDLQRFYAMVSEELSPDEPLQKRNGILRLGPAQSHTRSE